MTNNLLFLLLGLGNGAVYAALGLALVMTYRSSGVVNFGTGAVALYVAYNFAFLRQGKILDPIPTTTVTPSIGTGELGVVPAMAVALLLGAVLGVLLYVLIFRPLRTAAPAARAVASIGVLIVIQALLANRVGTTPVSVKPILPQDSWRVGGLAVPGDRVYFAAIIVGLAVLLTIWFRLSRFGLATRAAAESEKGALVTGLSPERIAIANWALSTAVAGLSGILIAPIVPLVPASYTLFIVPALAAALVGNFTSVGLAVGAGIVIGMLQSWMTYLQIKITWLPSSGMAELIPLVVIMIFLVVRGRALPSRGSIIAQSIGRAPRPRGVLAPGAVIAVAAVLGLVLLNSNWRSALITTLILAVIALSQVVVTGFTGQISLAQLTLAGVGAFTLTRLQHQVHVPFPIAPILAGVVAMVIGVLVGLPALRIRGLPVAVVTFALSLAVYALWFNNNDFNGGSGGAPIDAPKIFGLDLGVGAGAHANRIQFGLLCTVVLLLVAFAVAKLRTSRLGVSMLAVRANERSAAAAGIDVARTKVLAFAIGGFVAGVGGSLLAYQSTVADPNSFDPISGIALFTTVYLAGVTCVSGGVLAGVIAGGGVLDYVFSHLLHLGSYYTIISGILLVVTVILNPEGIIGPLHANVAWVRRRLGRTTAAAPATATTGETPTDSRMIHEPHPGVVMRVESAGVRYGGVVAVDDVSFDVHGGEILGLIGPNGAGKTTLIDAVSGFAHCTGSVGLEGAVVSNLKPHRRVRAGLGRTFQGIELYEDLTVRENVEVGTVSAKRTRGAPAPDLDRLFALMKLDAAAERPVRELSQGQRQLVSVARALAGRPKVVLLDEPAGGLDSTESLWLGERLKALRDAGITIVMVDHDMGLVLNVCDRIVVLDLGRVIAVGTPEEIQCDPAVTKAYLGTTHQYAETVAEAEV